MKWGDFMYYYLVKAKNKGKKIYKSSVPIVNPLVVSQYLWDDIESCEQIPYLAVLAYRLFFKNMEVN